MKKALKILGITLGSTIGLVLLVLAVALWVLFTPARLTPIVRDVASHYVQCEHEIGNVELTFFSTFPHFGLAIDSVLLIHAVEAYNLLIHNRSNGFILATDHKRNTVIGDNKRKNRKNYAD